MVGSLAPRLADIVSDIHKNWPDCAITLSVGEMEHDAYQTLFDAGADRYLLRHETYNDAHYRKLHPASLSARHRQNCLWDLKSIGYQIGAGFMVGAPFQTTENLADDMLFLKELNPHMVGIGPLSLTTTHSLLITCRNVGIDTLSAWADPSYATESTSPGNNRPRYDFSDRKGTGNSRRS